MLPRFWIVTLFAVLIFAGSALGAAQSPDSGTQITSEDSEQIAPVSPDGSLTGPLATGVDSGSTVSRFGWNARLLTAYCVLIVMASVIGGWLPSLVELTHTRMQTTMSFVGGLMLGIAMFHLLPHAAHHLSSTDQAARWMMVGIVSTFLLIRMFHFHHHGPLEVSPSEAIEHFHLPHAHSCEHDHDHDHDREKSSVPSRSARSGSDAVGESGPAVPHDPDRRQEVRNSAANRGAQPGPSCQHAHQLSWVGIAAGLSLHTLIDGIALAASVQADSTHRVWMSLYGLGTFLAVMLHKPLDAVSITSLMAASGWPQRSRNMVNAGFAMMCPAGAILFLLGTTQLRGIEAELVGNALAFSAGVFVCISLSDLLPEMEFHAHNRGRLSVALALGILLAFGITFLEPAHLH